MMEAPDRANRFAHVAQVVEHSLGKGEVTGSIPVMGTRDCRVAWDGQALLEDHAVSIAG